MLAGMTYVQRRRPIGVNEGRSVADVAWRITWPFILSTLLGFAMLLITLLIGALETASLAKSTDTSLYGTTSSTGAGFWCGLFFFIAAVFILAINFKPRIRVWATLAFFATIIAAAFAVILIGLDAKAVQDGRNNFSTLPDKTNIIITQLSFAIVELILCFIFIGIYIMVARLAPSRLRQTQRVYVY